MRDAPTTELRRGWTTGACATAAVRSALARLWDGAFLDPVSIRLPKGEEPIFPLAHSDNGEGWAEAGVTKDAGDDPDVTHGCLVIARVAARSSGQGVLFRAGEGVGTVTKPGLPIEIGEAAINPVPRQMMTDVVAAFGRGLEVEITISIPGGATLAAKTWNPRLGIEGGLSILGTTGIVRPFSCAAWIASIHRGIDVARASGLTHVAGCTGATSEATVQQLYRMPDHAMLDMGDFAGGLLKYLKRHPVAHLTVGGGIGKMTKLSQGALDLHSARSQVDFARLATDLNQPTLKDANTALDAYGRAGPAMADLVATGALRTVQTAISDAPISVDTVVTDRGGAILARAGERP
ncbi:MAG: cobalt-precorrin-5B (C(1))-methyltransferase [Pseudomonadota bacterium]